MKRRLAPQTGCPPGSFGAPVIGEIREWAADPLQFAQSRAQRYGPIWSTHLLGRPCVVLLEPAGNRFMLSQGSEHFSWRAGWGRAMLRLMGGGLSLTDGHQHDQQRSLLKPAFAHAALQQLQPQIQHLIRQQLQTWLDAQPICLLERLQTLAFDVALLVVCGRTPDPIAEALHHDFAAFTAGLFTPLPYPIPATPYFRAQKAGERLRQTLSYLIELRRLNLAADALDSLSLMLQVDPNRPDDQLISELLLLLWAGHDTVASLLTWICIELAQHPDILQRLRQELSTNHHSLLDHVLREAERLHPPAPGGFRGVVEAFEYAGYHVPQGWLAMYSSVYTHQMPSLWHNPTQFNPDRFAAPWNEGKQAYSLVGFGGGPRICIGLALAQIEMRLVLRELLANYQWQLVPNQDLRPVWLPTNQPRSGGLITIQRF